MLKYKILILLILSQWSAHAHLSTKELDNLYNKVAMGQVNDINMEHNIAEILETINSVSSTAEDKLKAHLILGFLYRIQGASAASLDTAIEGERLAGEHKEYLWQARLNGFISTAYRQRNELKTSKEYLLRAISISKRAPKNIGLIWFNLNANKELAYHASFDNNLEEAIRYTRISTEWAEKLQDAGSVYLIAVNYHYIGILNQQSGQLDKAIANLEVALELLSEARDSVKSPVLRNKILVDLGEIYMKKEDFPKAYTYFNRVQNDHRGAKPFSLMQDLYSNLMNYYLHTNNLDSLTFYKNKLDSIEKSVSKLDPDFSNNFSITGVLLNEIAREDEKRIAQLNTLYWAVGVLAFLLLGGGLYTYSKRTLSKKPKSVTFQGTGSKEEKSKETVADLSRIEEHHDAPAILYQEIHKADVKIAKGTIDRLEELFKEFEQSKQFLDSNVNVGLLASQFNTNNKYITYTLKSMYDKDFATYINDLRVNYLIDLLVEEPKYRDYKISYLADLAGFSSHSKFATNFKKIKGMSPSEFIDSLTQ